MGSIFPCVGLFWFRVGGVESIVCAWSVDFVFSIRATLSQNRVGVCIVLVEDILAHLQTNERLNRVVPLCGSFSGGLRAMNEAESR